MRTITLKAYTKPQKETKDFKEVKNNSLLYVYKSTKEDKNESA
jgi:hypothetical protein